MVCGHSPVYASQCTAFSYSRFPKEFSILRIKGIYYTCFLTCKQSLFTVFAGHQKWRHSKIEIYAFQTRQFTSTGQAIFHASPSVAWKFYTSLPVLMLMASMASLVLVAGKL